MSTSELIYWAYSVGSLLLASKDKDKDKFIYISLNKS